MQLDEMEAILGIDYSASVLQQIEHELLRNKQIDLYVKRDDLLHPIISGNKWRKLKYCIQHALDSGHDHLISMGGTWSNHLHALAYIGKQLNIRTTALIRGENTKFDSPTMKDLQTFGMNIQFVDRDEFRELRKYRLHNDPPASTNKGYWIPEGGATKQALLGVKELKQEICNQADIIMLACGTGTTLAGLMPNNNKDYQLIGIAALKGKTFLENDVKSLLENNNIDRWYINYEYHCGGFAKTTTELLAFIKQFEQQTNLPIEPVYSGKLFYGLFDLINKNYFKPGSKIIAIHTGGLQGKRKTND